MSLVWGLIHTTLILAKFLVAVVIIQSAILLPAMVPAPACCRKMKTRRGSPSCITLACHRILGAIKGPIQTDVIQPVAARVFLSPIFLLSAIGLLALAPQGTNMVTKGKLKISCNKANDACPLSWPDVPDLLPSLDLSILLDRQETWRLLSLA